VPVVVELRLAGQTNERGVMPTQRVLRGQPYEKIFLTVRNRTSRDVAGMIACRLPDGVSLLPDTNQSVVVAAGQEAHLAFYASLTEDAPVGSYPLQFRGLLGDGETTPVTVTLVKLPQWRIGFGDTPGNMTWQEVSAEAVAADGFVDIRRAAGHDVPKVVLGEAKFVSPSRRRVRLWLGSGDSIAVSLNGKTVMDLTRFRAAERDENWTDVDLPAGENVLVVKQQCDLAPAGWYLRVEDLP
jgi:hypothetical protein